MQRRRQLLEHEEHDADAPPRPPDNEAPNSPYQVPEPPPGEAPLESAEVALICKAGVHHLCHNLVASIYIQLSGSTDVGIIGQLDSVILRDADAHDDQHLRAVAEFLLEKCADDCATDTLLGASHCNTCACHCKQAVRTVSAAITLLCHCDGMVICTQLQDVLRAAIVQHYYMSAR